MQLGRDSLKKAQNSEGEILKIIEFFCFPLDYINQNGVVYRDFKSQNILDSSKGLHNIFLLRDLGVSKQYL